MKTQNKPSHPTIGYTRNRTQYFGAPHTQTTGNVKKLVALPFVVDILENL
jgi:hypothetical protein